MDVPAALVIIKEIRRHDRLMYPALQATGQGMYTGHAVDDLPFPDELALTPAVFQYGFLDMEQCPDPVCVCLEITEQTRFIMQ